MERREFVRIKAQLPVRYKFLDQEGDKRSEDVFEGTTSNISAAGMLLVGKVPDLAWVLDLLTQKTVVGMNVLLKEDEEPVRAIGRVAWVEELDAESRRCAMGINFREITKESQDRIFRFVIRAQIS